MRNRILFICGSMNQTTQMHQISEHLPEHEQAFSPYYCDGPTEILRRLGLIEFTIAGNKLAGRCRGYLQSHGLPIDYQGRERAVRPGGDLHGPVPSEEHPRQPDRAGPGGDHGPGIAVRFISSSASGSFRAGWRARRRPGSAIAYRAFCVASEGYRDFFIRKGVRPEKIVVTGIPNFDDCRRYRRNDFPYRHYVLACTSPLREIFRREDRAAFIRRAVELAGGRRAHLQAAPERERRARHPRDPPARAGRARCSRPGSAEEMIANCDVLITRFSSTAFVGLALGKETYSDFDLDELRRLMPVQNGAAAPRIAQCLPPASRRGCREVM